MSVLPHRQRSRGPPRGLSGAGSGRKLKLFPSKLVAFPGPDGIGAPGHWEMSSPSGGPVWSADPPAPTGLDDTRRHRAMPVRTLLPNERIGMGALGFGAVIMRTDLGQIQAELDGKFTPADRQQLQEIYRIVGKLGI